MIINFCIQCIFGVVSELWAFILSLSGLDWERPKRVSDLLNNWSGLCGKKTYSTIWGAVPACLLWTIWREKNL